MSKSERTYIFLCTIFSIISVIGNLTYRKFVSIDLAFHTFELSVAAIIYPLTFFITDLITEFYGKERANFCVILAISMNLISITIIGFMNKMNATSWSIIDNDIFHKLFGFYGIAFVGSIIACYISQAIDIILYLYLKKITGGKKLWLRNAGSTSISLFFDTFIAVSFISFFGGIPQNQMWNVILNSYSWKVIFTFSCIPIFYLCVYLIKKIIKN